MNYGSRYLHLIMAIGNVGYIRITVFQRQCFYLLFSDYSQLISLKINYNKDPWGVKFYNSLGKNKIKRHGKLSKAFLSMFMVKHITQAS